MEKYLKRIQDKLEKHPELEEEINVLHNKLEEIFECGVELNLIDLDFANDYEKQFNEYDDDFSRDLDTMTLGDFIDYLNEEDEQECKLFIDPIYLNDGLNEINNVLITTIDDKVIVVPKAKNFEIK